MMSQTLAQYGPGNILAAVGAEGWRGMAAYYCKIPVVALVYSGDQQPHLFQNEYVMLYPFARGFSVEGTP